MVATLPNIDALHQKTSVTAIALHPTLGKLLIGKKDGLVQIVDLESEQNNIIATINVNSQIIDVAWSMDKIVVLDETNGLHVFSNDGEEVWTSEFDAGGAELVVGKQILALDGIGTLRQFTLDGQEYESSQRDVRSFEMIQDSILLITENQSVVKTDDHLNIVFERPQRGEIGEDIVAVGSSQGSAWFVAREGHALVPGEEEALEIEFYLRQELLDRKELKGRMKASISDSLNHFIGLDNGDLVAVNQNEIQLLTSFDYPIQCLAHSQNTIIVGTWFYVFGFDLETNEIAWQIEHKGMLQGIEVDDSGRIAFFGDDQNDYTGAEPVGVCNINQERAEVDPSFLQGWFEEAVVEVETDPNIVYRTVDDYTSLLSLEEQESLESQQHGMGIEFDSLSTAMNEDLPTGSFNNQEQDLDELLQFLHEEAAEVIAPEAYAGENQTISLHNGNTAVVTLDGSQSSDPQNRIATWSWLDSTGKEISTEAKLRVKLSLGVHQFELRVFDVDGGMTTDSLQITLESSDS